MPVLVSIAQNSQVYMYKPRMGPPIWGGRIKMTSEIWQMGKMGNLGERKWTCQTKKEGAERGENGPVFCLEAVDKSVVQPHQHGSMHTAGKRKGLAKSNTGRMHMETRL